MTAVAPDQLFFLGLLLKVIMTATIVATATIVVERTGPFIGALSMRRPSLRRAPSAVSPPMPRAPCLLFLMPCWRKNAAC
jgi:hypothetical protein